MELVYQYLTDIFTWAYGIFGFILLASLPINILLKGLKGKGTFI